MTMANLGRLINRSAIMGSSVLNGIYRIHLGAGTHLVHAVDDDDFPFLNAGTETLFIIDRVAQRNVPAFHDALVVDDVNVALVGIVHHGGNVGSREAVHVFSWKD